jgi:hypothetical protein
MNVNNFFVFLVFLSFSASDTHLDVRRIDLLVELVLLRRSPLVPFVITMNENCPEALMHMSCYILVVTALADDILTTINIVTKKIRNLLNQDLSLTTDSTREILKSEFSRYFSWLRLHQDGLIKVCRNNEIVCSVNKSVKAWLKGEEYESPHQIVESYRQKYSKYLTNMNISMRSFRVEDITQAVKDVTRDTIILNNILHSSSVESLATLNSSDHSENSNNNSDKNCNSSETIINISESMINVEHDNDLQRSPRRSSKESTPNLMDAIVKELCKSLSILCHKKMEFCINLNDDKSFFINSCPSNRRKKHNHHPPSSSSPHINNDICSLEFEKIKCDDSVSTSSYLVTNDNSTDSFEDIQSSDLRSLRPPSENFERIERASPSEFIEFESFTESLKIVTDNMSKSETSCDKSCDRSCLSAGTNTVDSDFLHGDTNGYPNPNDGSKLSIMNLHKKLIDLLVKHILLAASRTIAGGDAFLVLEDLYGGEGLLFSPRSYKRQQRNNPRHRHTPNLVNETDSIIDNSSVRSEEEDTTEKSETETPEISGGIRVSISSTGIKITLKEQYNLFLKHSIEQNMELTLPLISFECTTTTQISFTTSNPNPSPNPTQDIYDKLLYNAENFCHRTISIEPFIHK